MHFCINMKRRIFKYSIRHVQKKFHLIVGSMCTFYELKSRATQYFGKRGFYLYTGLIFSSPFQNFIPHIWASKSLVPCRRGIILQEASLMSGVFRNIDPPPHRPANVYRPAFGAGGGHTRWVERESWVNSSGSEDARHCSVLYSTYVRTLWSLLSNQPPTYSGIYGAADTKQCCIKYRKKT
jgi:hypothetical protein